MSNVNCIYNGDLSYTLLFESEKSKFEADFKITCPDDFIYQPVHCYDGFLFGIIFKAMEVYEDLEINFPISKQAYQHASYLIEAWHNLLPKKYKKIKLVQKYPYYIFPQTHGNDECIAAFSGGVDASFTLIRHQEKDWGDSSYNIKNVLSVHGFDIPTYKQDEFNALIERVSPIFEQYACRSFEVWTDLREKSGQDWEMSFSAQLASCLHLFSEHFDTALLASSESYQDMILPWGSTPATDYLLSGGGMKIVHDGAGYSRTEKVERIAQNLAASQYIKVCWKNQSMENCGQCEKCYRTRLNFMAVGHKEVGCFDGKIQAYKIPAIKVNSAVKAEELSSILRYIQDKNVGLKWVLLIRMAILKWSFIYRPLNAFKKISRALRKKA